ncbi:unknown [Bacillus thuringiensis phage MZTP02]|uniref:Uncharacterized protein n=1 Tax=Bacillus thuringiensis phage MZTP02 TaxID=311221 RepID=Q56AR4_9CAUD|nr:unknown [Bacillus thuringiensis phage MZTP02]
MIYVMIIIIICWCEAYDSNLGEGVGRVDRRWQQHESLETADPRGQPGCLTAASIIRRWPIISRRSGWLVSNWCSGMTPMRRWLRWLWLTTIWRICWWP